MHPERKQLSCHFGLAHDGGGAQASSYRAGGLGAQAMIRSASQALWFQLQGDNTGLPVLLGCPHEHYGEACRRPPWPADFLLPFEAGDFNAPQLFAQCDKVSPFHMAPPNKAQNLLSSKHGQAF